MRAILIIKMKVFDLIFDKTASKARSRKELACKFASDLHCKDNQ